MKPEKYLSRLQLIISMILSFFALIIIPMILEESCKNGFCIATLRGNFLEMGQVLPSLTKSAIYFTDIRAIRYSLFILFSISGVLIDVFLENKILTGTYHSVSLIIWIIVIIFFLLSCIFPLMPL